MLDRTKPVQTRDGRRVEVLKWDVEGLFINNSKFNIPYTIVGIVYGLEKNEVYKWRSDGAWLSYLNTTASLEDLINTPPQPETRGGWMNVYPTPGLAHIYPTRAEADAGVSATRTRIACIPYTYTYTEGQGLDQK